MWRIQHKHKLEAHRAARRAARRAHESGLTPRQPGEQQSIMKTDLTLRVALSASLIAAVIQPNATRGAEAALAAAAEAAPAAADAESPDTALESVIVTVHARPTSRRATVRRQSTCCRPPRCRRRVPLTYGMRSSVCFPSLNHAAFAGDYGALTDTVQLRGLSPDHVLILINGKRAAHHGQHLHCRRPIAGFRSG